MSTDRNIRPADTSADSQFSVAELNRECISRLEPSLGRREAEAVMRLLWEELKGYSPTDLIMKGDYKVSEYMLDKIRAAVGRVEAGEPVQYVVGRARFCGLDFEVTPAVLIPRPETAGLVDIIVDRTGGRSDLRVTDLCTGSGCIAIALARALPFARVTAVDISPEALEVARRNGAALRTRVGWVCADILSLPIPAAPEADIVVCNPPYVLESERASMEQHVTDHEPALALFVPDSDPLRFYHAAARYAMTALSGGGRLYFELNPLTADRLAGELRHSGWEDVELLRDFAGAVRYLTATRPRS